MRHYKSLFESVRRYVSIFMEALELKINNEKVIFNPESYSKISSLCDDKSLKIPRCRGLIVNGKEVIAFQSTNLLHDEVVNTINQKFKGTEHEIKQDESNCFRVFFYHDQNKMIVSPSTEEHKGLTNIKGFLEGFKKGQFITEVEVVETDAAAAERHLL